MTKNELIYIEIRPAEGYMLTDGEIVTDYVCVLNKEDMVNAWYEIEAEDVPQSDEDEKVEDKE